MTDKKDQFPITDPHHVQPVFVNEVVNRGYLNGVVNVTFAVALFTPEGDGVVPDRTINARLRMDVPCARQLYAELGSLLKSLEDVPAAGETTPAVPASERMN